jgi:Xaa-Pro aminopeptidase
MVGEPTTFTRGWFDAWPDAADAVPVLNAARAIKTEQEVQRITLANEICAAAMRHVAEQLRPGMKESEAASIWQGFVHGEGTGWHGKVDLAFGFSLVWSGPGIRTFTATGDRPVQRDQPTLFEIWVVADGYWADHTKLLCPGELRDDYAQLERGLMEVYERAIDHCRPGASFADLDRLIRNGLTELGYGGQPSHPICHGVGVRAHEPPDAHQAGSGTIEHGMVLAIEPGCYWDGGGGLRVEDNFLITAAGAQKLSSFPDGVVRCG